jgi:hypothetical protein
MILGKAMQPGSTTTGKPPDYIEFMILTSPISKIPVRYTIKGSDHRITNAEEVLRKFCPAGVWTYA